MTDDMKARDVRSARGEMALREFSHNSHGWAAASPLLFLRTLLRFEPDIRANKLHLAPAVPDWIGTLRLERIPIMGGHLGVEVTGEVVKVLQVPEDLTIVSDPRRPTIPQ